eukprot:3121551-Amphidinium_carterae.4
MQHRKIIPHKFLGDHTAQQVDHTSQEVDHTSRRRPAAGASSSPSKPATSWTCKYFTSDEGCKKGKACDAKHLPKEKGCTICGSLRHDSKKCERPTKKSTQPKDSGDRRRPQARKPDPKKSKDKGKPGAKAKKSAKPAPRRPKAREAAIEDEDDNDEEQSSLEQTSAEEPSE